MPVLAPKPSAPATAGGLHVVNGQHRGQTVPLKLPVTLLGAGAGCDVRLAAAGVGEVHAIIAVTPAGPALRSLFPGATRVNGNPAAAAILKDGDHLAVGPCQFRFEWSGPAAVQADEPEEVVAAPFPPTPAVAEFRLREREEALAQRHAEREAVLKEQAAQLADLMDRREQHVRELLKSLTAARDELRAKKQEAASDLLAAKVKAREIGDLHAARVGAKQRARKAAAKYLARVRAKAATDLAAAAVARAQAERDAAALAAERDRWHRDAMAVSDRLADGWKMLQDGQARLAADRGASEAELSRLFQLLDARTESVNEEHAARKAAAAALDAQCQDLHAEIVGLGNRAENLRVAVEDLEQKRKLLHLHAPAEPAGPAVFEDVSLAAADGRDAEQILQELLNREAELDREWHRQRAKKAEIDRVAEELSDGRLLLRDQLNELAALRAEEAGVAEELARIAAETAAREEAAAARERANDRADECRRSRERLVWETQQKLDAWQAALADEETRTLARLRREEAEQTALRNDLLDRQEALKDVMQNWVAVRQQERDALAAELEAWVEDRAAYAEARERFNADRKQWLADLGRAAALALAADEAKTDDRGFRVRRKAWEKRFRKVNRELTDRLARADAATHTAAARQAALRAAAIYAFDAASAMAHAAQQFDLARLAAGAVPQTVPLLPAGERPADTLQEARAEARGAVSALLQADQHAEIVPLLRAG